MQDNNLIIYKNDEGNIIVNVIYKDEIYGYLKRECLKYLKLVFLI